MSSSSPMLSPEYASKSRAKDVRRKFRRRKYQEPFIASTSVQNDGSRRRVRREKQLEGWRNNLTALSHCHNLYVVAYQDELHVFEPRYSDQQVPGDAPLIIGLPVTAPRLRGTLRHDRPHSVNHLIIGQLGDQEIILCSCDDGDVLAFYTDAVAKAVKRTQATENSTVAMDHDVRPFFHVNIGMSAWGLAIHTKARMIAISANTHVITVFAFALNRDSRGVEDRTYSAPCRQRFEDNSSKLLDEEWISDDVFAPGGWHLFSRNSPQKDQIYITRRTRDVCVLLEGHGSNIPTVSFCNTDEDPDGRFLVSADINGCLIVWDVHDRAPVRAFKPASEDDPLSNSGWAAHWLDSRSFRTAPPNKAFRPRSVFYAEMQKKEELSAVIVAGHQSMDERTEAWRPLSTPGEDDSPTGETTPHESVDGDQDSVEASVTEWSDGSESSPRLFNGTISPPIPPRSHPPCPATPYLRPRDARLEPYQCTISNLQNATGSTQHSWRPHWPNPSTNLWVSNPTPNIESAPKQSPIFLTRPQSMCLFQSPRLELLSRQHPFTTLDDPLDQEVPIEWQDHYFHVDRLNYTQYIPELGVILAGSPKGRVAVLTLHAVRDSHLTPLSEEVLYTMRLDAILPTPKQERRGQRPAFPLSGVAAGPVQGQMNGAVEEGAKAGRTWRVLLLFRDEAILAYEIWRRGEDDAELGVSGVEDLYV